MRPGDHRLAEERRLQDIVTPALGQRSAHENHVRHGEQAAQLADGIEQQDAGLAAIRASQCGPPDVRYVRVIQLARCHGEPFGLSGRQNQHQPGMAGRQLPKGGDHGIVFIHVSRGGRRHGAGGDPDLGGLHAVEQALYRRVRRQGTGLEIVLEIARHFHPLRRDIFVGQKLLLFVFRSLAHIHDGL